MTLIAPLQIYIDESGSPDFYEIRLGDLPKAYVPCAVAVPAMSADALQRILPRRMDGKLLKSSDNEFSAEVAYRFVDDLLLSDAEIAAILIDPAHPTSVSAARNNAALVNRRRQTLHHPKISEAGFGYSIFTAQLVTNILMVSLNRKGSRPTFFDVVLDKGCLRSVDERRWQTALKDAADCYGTTVGRVEWTHEEHEPLLLLPDLVAGILHRDAIQGDVQRARQLLQDAGRAGRISLQDGHKIQLNRDATNPPRTPQV